MDGGYFYIAQPPLYKVKRGQREEYIETEEEMNELILEMGMEGLKLVKLEGKQQYTGAQFKEILYACVDLEKFADIVVRRGVDFDKYIES